MPTRKKCHGELSDAWSARVRHAKRLVPFTTNHGVSPRGRVDVITGHISPASSRMSAATARLVLLL